MQVLYMLIYFVLGILQLFAIMDGLAVWFGLNSIVSFILGIFLAYIPIVGTGFGMYGAVTAWGWSWMQAIGLFFGPFLLIIVLALISSFLTRDRASR